jgi:uncharacterized protein (TIGR02246 family)
MGALVRQTSDGNCMMPLVLFLFASFQSNTPQGCDAEPAVTIAVRAVADGIIAADNARDIEKVLGFYAADAILMPPNAEPIHGRVAIRPGYETLFATSDPAAEGRIDEVCASGSVAFVRGHNGGQMKGRGSNPSRPLNDYYFMTLRLEADSVWRISHLIWHPGSR